MRCTRARRLHLGVFRTRIADRTRCNKIGAAPPIPQLQYVVHAAFVRGHANSLCCFHQQKVGTRVRLDLGPRSETMT
jgi:hypothetical protein